MDVALPCDIRDIEVVAEYRGTVFEQTVFVAVRTGELLQLFDKNVLLDDTSIGEAHDLVAGVLPTDGARYREDEPSIRRPPNPISDWSYEFAGEVVAITDGAEWFEKTFDVSIVLDIGVGTIVIAQSAELVELHQSGLSAGDEVVIPGSRIDLLDVLDEG